MKSSYFRFLSVAMGVMLIAAACSPSDLATLAEAQARAGSEVVIEVGEDGTPFIAEIDFEAEDSSSGPDDADGAEDSSEDEQDEDFKLTGPVEALSEDSITVLGFTFNITEDTELDEGLQVGVIATVEYVILDDQTLVALEIETDADDDLDEDVDDDQDEADDEDVDDEDQDDFDDLEDSKLTGTVEAFNQTSITINGLVFTINQNTELDEGLQVGVIATVEFLTLSDGTRLATEVETDADDDQDEDNDGEDDEDDEDKDEDDNSGSGSSNSGSGKEDDD
ncbi:MAG: DUF5666 domain-containing protein [Chloroflexi bacterium]|nr:DUF5666 domain-containing protein [Chloroflexota bacterium]